MVWCDGAYERGKKGAREANERVHLTESLPKTLRGRRIQERHMLRSLEVLYEYLTQKLIFKKK